MTAETILIVEDNTVLREGLRDILSIEGFNILTAGHGREALDEMKKGLPALILSDIAMPEMDGVAFFSAVRARPDWMSIPFVFLTAHGEKEDLLAGKKLGAEDYLVKPLTRKELVMAVRGRLERSRQIRMAQLQATYQTSLAVMASAIDRRDPFSRGRLERVTVNALAMAEKLGLPEPRLEQLRFGAILHDIGRIHIRESILLKSSPLNEEEWEEIRGHPVTGSEMIRGIPYLEPAVPVVRHHHERWDGRGYPDGLAGEEIPVEARIVAVADSYDAMTAGRPYRPAMQPEQARAEIQRCSGKQYDGTVVEAFEAVYEAGQVQAAKLGG